MDARSRARLGQAGAGANADIVWLAAARQRLGLVPALGGGVAEWSWLGDTGEVHLWRPWCRSSEDRYTLASFAMLPWSNRISLGGFCHGGQWHEMTPNRAGERHAIHGDGWLQPWQVARADGHSAEMRLVSRRHGGTPYAYDAVQRFDLHEDELEQTVSVTHRGTEPLPYGLGLHPWFPRTPGTRLCAHVNGVWLSGLDPIPTRHSASFPDTWDLNGGADMNGSLIDNGYTGWDGTATIRWPERNLLLHMTQYPLETPRGPVPPSYCLVYRPRVGPAFCFEPITQPIDAFHLEGRPGLVTLTEGETLTLRVRWRVETMEMH
jgi:aldose 1-epimerase